MSHLVTSADWNFSKTKLKQKWAQLTDDDLPNPGERQEELIAKLQQRTGESREVVETAVREVSYDSSSYMYQRFLSRSWLGA